MIQAGIPAVKTGAPIAEGEQASVCQLFVIDVQNEYIPVGYGVFNTKGDIVAAFPTSDEAVAYLGNSLN